MKPLAQQILWIEWVDSFSQPGWHDSHFEPTLPICESVGFFVSENDDVVCLALNRGQTPGMLPYGDIISIPKVSIRKRRIVRYQKRS